MKRKLIVLLVAVVIFFDGFAQQLPQLGKDPVKKVVSAMTLEEKVSIVVGAGMRMPGAPQREDRGNSNGHSSNSSKLR
ncbi:MAG TPA: hypothetical protein PLS74_12260 [Bacteroidales bacterium]|nr:hypothetical protein [Bacteroidales bacterium]